MCKSEVEVRLIRMTWVSHLPVPHAPAVSLFELDGGGGGQGVEEDVRARQVEEMEAAGENLMHKCSVCDGQHVHSASKSLCVHWCVHVHV